MAAATVRDFIRDWRHVGLPAFAAILLPWQNKLTEMSLVSDWFQPALNIGASIIGPLSCYVGYAVLARQSRKDRRRVMLASFCMFIACVILCFVIKMTIGILFFPDPTIQVAIWIAEICIYLLVFLTFAVCMVSTGLLLQAG